MCTSITAGKQATSDGLILISRNEDCLRNNWNKYLAYRPHPEYYVSSTASIPNPVVTKTTWTLGNGLQVPLPKAMFAYSAAPDAIGGEEASASILNRFFYEERGINENNVAISATNSMEDINSRARHADQLPASQPGIAECIIPTLILPQAKTARHGVELLGHYVETYGASEENGVLIGDPNEAWYVEIGSAHHWVAVKIPQDCYLAVANSMRVHGVDLEDERNVLHSAGLFEFVAKHKLLENPDRHHFDFAKAFGTPGIPDDVDRIWLAQKLLTPSLHQKTRQGQYPLFLKPDRPIELRNVMSVLRATYQGTELEGKAKRPIGVERTGESHIITLNAAMPDPLQGMIWQAIGTPLGAPFMPFYCAMTDIPPAYAQGSSDYNPLSAYWAFRGLFALGSTDNGEFIHKIQAVWSEHESQFLSDQKYMQGLLRTMYAEEPNAAVAFAGNYSTGIAYQMVGVANYERNALMTKITQESTYSLRSVRHNHQQKATA